MKNNFNKLVDIINEAKNKFPNLDLKKENNTEKLMEFLKVHDVNMFKELKEVVEKINKTLANTDLSLQNKNPDEVKIDTGKTIWKEIKK